MITFISTFPPAMCGIGTYTNYLVSKIPSKEWRVVAFRLEEFLRTGKTPAPNNKVLYHISLLNPSLPHSIDGKLIWFQHAFGMWGRLSTPFLRLIKEAKGRDKRVIATFHTIHFETNETVSGMKRDEEDLLKEVLPYLDAVTVFTDGANRAVIRRFPEYRDKVVVLRHGVHLYPLLSKEEARERLFRYLIENEEIPHIHREEMKAVYSQLSSPRTVLIGNFGFITPDKDPLQLYALGEMVRERLPNHRIILLYIGCIQKRKDREMEKGIPILEGLRALHDGRLNLFIEDYLPEEIFPVAFRALDVTVFWCRNATQSGRMAHAMGAGGCIAGRRIEGIGETLDLAGLLSGVSLDDMAGKIARLIIEEESRRKAEVSALEYAKRFSFENQAQKHILLKEAVLSGKGLPPLDRTLPRVTFILPQLAISRMDGLEYPPEEITAFLNVADDVDIHLPVKDYHKIPLKDGEPPPVEKMEEAIRWIKKKITSGKVLVFCRYGAGRSASVIIGYLCSIGYSYEEALRLVVSKKPDINPLPGLYETIKEVLKRDSLLYPYPKRSLALRGLTSGHPNPRVLPSNTRPQTLKGISGQ